MDHLGGKTEAKANIQPVVMVVEDVKEDLDDRVDHFKHLGCLAFGFLHSDDAIDALFTVPGIDLIMTDIDLDGSGQDESGIALARFVRDIDMSIPVVGYSAFVTDQGLKDEDRVFFSGALLPKAMKAETINKKFEDLTSQAVRHRSDRIEGVEVLIEKLRKKYNIDIGEIGLVRDLILNTDAAANFDETLIEASYSLSIVHPRKDDRISEPVLMWLRKNADIFEAEVYGFSTLYAVGTSESEAVEKLIELMKLFVEDIIKQPDQEIYDPNAFRLRSYLLNIFGRVEK